MSEPETDKTDPEPNKQDIEVEDLPVDETQEDEVKGGLHYNKIKW